MKMWCLVNLPNGTNFAVECDPKGPSQECLAKVCENLGIICEQDYFGLIYVRDDKENAAGEEISGNQWMNLRNPLGKHGHIVSNHVMLSMRVKFWVPAHLILQESVRNIFYSQARQELLEGHLRAENWTNASKLAALLMQSDGIRCSPNGGIVQNECLPIVTRKRKCSENEGRRASVNEPTTSTITPVSPTNIYSEYIIRPCDDFEEPMPDNFLDMIASEHEKLSKYKMPPTSAKYWLLEEIQALEGYGEEIFEGTINGESTYKYKIGVNPHGIAIYKENEEKYSIPYTAIESAKSIRRTFRLTYMDENHESTTLELKLSCHRSASALYRAITEKHAFYSCETVRSVVTTQFIRDLKGTIISMFNEDSELGKRYVFDIQRTCREVYDNARRTLHARGIEINSQEKRQTSPLSEEFAKELEDETEQDNRIDKIVDCRIKDALTCRICMDNEIDAMFSPCSHITSCQVCAEKCDRCPLCRADIESVKRIFLPAELRSRHNTI